jgi:hypothetical protein
VEIVLKWREKIAKKMNASHSEIFREREELEFIQELEHTLQEEETKEELGQD